VGVLSLLLLSVVVLYFKQKSIANKSVREQIQVQKVNIGRNAIVQNSPRQSCQMLPIFSNQKFQFG
jgi:hypothetical protein